MAGDLPLVRIGAVCAAVLAAVGAFVVDGELELTLMMAAAVIAGLICFDVSMARPVETLVPWAALSLAPVLKTAPEVWFELRSSSGILFERYDHAGSLFFGGCVFAAVVIIARPAESLGSAVVGFDGAVIFGSATAGALSGASVAFLVDAGFGSVTAGRLLETPTWFVLAGILGAVVVAGSRTAHISVALAGVLITGAATSALLALSVAGRDLDRGWWAMLFAALGASAVATRGNLGRRADRNRRSNAPAVVALVVGLIAAASAIAARSDRTAWSPGWALLGLVSLAMFGLAMASKPLEDQGRTSAAPDRVDSGLSDDQRARQTRAQTNEALGADVDALGEKPETTTATQVPPAAEHAALLAVDDAAADDKPKDDKPASTLSDANLVASAQAAAAVRTAPPAQRHSLAPLAQAHHFDPSTGLLSSAGLQHAIARAFDVPRRAGHITILLFTIRDLDRIERGHGRLAAAAVTSEVAERVRVLLPSGSGARFGRAAYAVVFVGDRSNAHATTQWLARVLVQLRAPVEGGSPGDKIDLVAGMAQCYEGEDAASFVKRANSGLARAVHLAEPTLVAMP